MDLTQLKSDYNPLIAEFGTSGAAILAGVKPEEFEKAFEEENKSAEKLRSFIDKRTAAYEAYSERERGLLNKLEHFIIESGNAKSASDAIGIYPSTLSGIRSNSYPSKTEKFFDIIEKYFEIKHERAKKYSNTEYVPTSVSEIIYQAIRSVHIVGMCEIITGDTGIGKTRTIQKYYADNPNSVIVITPTYAETTVIGIMKLIAEKLGIYGLKRLDDLHKAVISKLHDGMLIIVDEAQHLKFSAADHLRTIADYFSDRGEAVGVCYVGNPSFLRFFEEKKMGIAGQIWNRSSLRPQLESSDVTLDDIKLLFPELAADKKNAELVFLHAIARTNGEGIRRAVLFYKNAYDRNNGNVEIDYLAGLARLGHVRIPNIGEIIKNAKAEI